MLECDETQATREDPPGCRDEAQAPRYAAAGSAAAAAAASKVARRARVDSEPLPDHLRNAAR